MAMPGTSVKEGPHEKVTVTAEKSTCGINTTLCHIGFGLSDTKKMFTMLKRITTPQLIA
jgi:hypothetical protein